ncbi:MAG: hypothetical protein K9L32_00575 [Chromatiaceae bacterium]|nr:hypothetical protein [Chromatiaceae bacterium]MCF8002699.1 hypothetical protein [Chromatiaceae bacterium]
MATHPKVAPPSIDGKPTGIEILYCSDGKFVIDWTLAGTIMESQYRAELKNDAKFTETKTGRIENSRYLPEYTRVETKWPLLRLQAANNTTRYLYTMRLRLYGHQVSGEGFRNTLMHALRMAKTKDATYDQKLRSAHIKTMKSVSDVSGKWQTVVDVAKFVEKTSHALLLTGAIFIPGAQGAAIAGIGAYLKGNAKYRETQRLGAAAIETASELVFYRLSLPNTSLRANTIPVSEAAKFTREIYLAFAECSVETAKVLAEGKPLDAAIAAGLFKMTGPLAGKLKAPGADISGYVMPVNIRVAINAGLAVITDNMQNSGSDSIIKFLRNQKAQQSKTRSTGAPPSAANIKDAELFRKVVDNAMVRLPSTSEKDDHFPYGLI